MSRLIRSGYIRYVGFLLVEMVKRMVMLQVVGVGRSCGGVELFGGLYGAKAEFGLTKT